MITKRSYGLKSAQSEWNRLILDLNPSPLEQAGTGPPGQIVRSLDHKSAGSCRAIGGARLTTADDQPNPVAI
jgi:hypothetical protein